MVKIYLLVDMVIVFYASLGDRLNCAKSEVTQSQYRSLADLGVVSL